jgi:large-conductance mechanosensitive channel
MAVAIIIGAIGGSVVAALIDTLWVHKPRGGMENAVN